MTRADLSQNVVVTLSATHGLTLVLELLEPYSEILNANNATSLNPVSLKETSMVMNKLSVEPPFAQGMGEIFQYANQTSPDCKFTIVSSFSSNYSLIHRR